VTSVGLYTCHDPGRQTSCDKMQALRDEPQRNTQKNQPVEHYVVTVTELYAQHKHVQCNNSKGSKSTVLG
jgi:hypothetical protein